jgi:hypothetical protein
MDTEAVINVLREDVKIAKKHFQDLSDNLDRAVCYLRDPCPTQGSLDRVRTIACSYCAAIDGLRAAQLRLKRFETDGVLPNQVRPRPPQRLEYARTSRKSA